VCCSVLQCVAVCCSVLQCVTVCCSVLQCVVDVLQCVAVCCSVLGSEARDAGREHFAALLSTYSQKTARYYVGNVELLWGYGF